ncbi:MAG: DUF460 domain-containing protein [Candidatus Nanohaloarchaea archaeon]|nr:DUF460 domain-containing protein [Candidatus Nanohaloarchaea archaeon]
MRTIQTIVGIDPGTTTGVAVIDIEGKLVDHRSKKEFSKGKIRRFIISAGKPVIVASDVNPAPSLVEKIARAFNTELNVPKEDISQKDKEKLVEDYSTRDMDSHEKDALAAAVKAYRGVKGVLKKIKARSEGKEASYGEVVEEFFKTDKSLHQSFESIKDREEDIEEVKNEDRNLEDKEWKEIAEKNLEKLKRRKKEVERLRNYRDKLEGRIEELESEKNRLEDQKSTEIKKSEEVSKWRGRAKNRKNTIQKLENKVESKDDVIEKLKLALKEVKNGKRAVPVLKSRENVKKADEDTLFIDGVETLPPSQVEVIITSDRGVAEYYRDKGIKVVKEEELEGMRLEDFYIVSSKDIEDKLAEDSDDFMEWLDEYRDRR